MSHLGGTVIEEHNLERTHAPPSAHLDPHRHRHQPRRLRTDTHPSVSPLRQTITGTDDADLHEFRVHHCGHRLHDLPGAVIVAGGLCRHLAHARPRPHRVLPRHGPPVRRAIRDHRAHQLGDAADAAQHRPVRAVGLLRTSSAAAASLAVDPAGIRCLPAHRNHPVHRQLVPRPLPVPGGRRQRPAHQHPRSRPRRPGHQHHPAPVGQPREAGDPSRQASRGDSWPTTAGPAHRRVVGDPHQPHRTGTHHRRVLGHHGRGPQPEAEGRAGLQLLRVDHSDRSDHLLRHRCHVGQTRRVPR